MANRNQKHQSNISGEWYCTDPDSDEDACIGCNACYVGAPEFFKEDSDGNAFVYRQPKTADEIELCQEQLDVCPVNSIGTDG